MKLNYEAYQNIKKHYNCFLRLQEIMIKYEELEDEENEIKILDILEEYKYENIIPKIGTVFEATRNQYIKSYYFEKGDLLEVEKI